MRTFRPLSGPRKRFLAWRVRGSPVDADRSRPALAGEPTEEAIEQAQRRAVDEIDPKAEAVAAAEREVEDEIDAAEQARIERAQQHAEEESDPPGQARIDRAQRKADDLFERGRGADDPGGAE